MAKTEGVQSIPADLLELYKAALTPVTPGLVVRGRYPWSIPPFRNTGKNPTPAQLEHRAIFQDCVKCFNVQPYSGGYPWNLLGPKNRSLWFSMASGSGLWYYDYFIQQSINTYLATGVPQWCKTYLTKDTFISSLSPNTNYGTRTYVYAGLPVGGEQWAWWNKIDPNANILRIWINGTLGPIGAQEAYYLDFYTSAGPWTETGLKWNNKPAIGALFHSEQSYGNFSGYIYITCPNVYSIVAKFRGPAGAVCTMAARNDPTESKRVRWLFY